MIYVQNVKLGINLWDKAVKNVIKQTAIIVIQILINVIYVKLIIMLWIMHVLIIVL